MEEESATTTITDMYEFMDNWRLTLQLAFLSFSVLFLWLTMGICQACVVGLMFASAIFCLEYRLMNLILWACILTVWFHGVSFGDSKTLYISWK